MFEDEVPGESTVDETGDEVKVEEAKPGLMFYLRQPTLLVNLIIMIVNWTTSSFCFYLISFELKNLGSIYSSTYASLFAIIVATLISGVIYEKVGLKITMIGSYSLGAIGALMINLFGWSGEAAGNEWIVPLFVLIS
jgi:CBS domain containing-hemolysin-like protein